MRCGALIDWKLLRAMRFGVRSSDFDTPRNDTRSLAVHSHSRFCRNEKFDGKVSLFSVVSIWKTFTPALAMSRPMRQFDECSSDLCWSMNDLLCCMVRTLWWWRSERY